MLGVAGLQQVPVAPDRRLVADDDDLPSGILADLSFANAPTRSAMCRYDSPQLGFHRLSTSSSCRRAQRALAMSDALAAELVARFDHTRVGDEFQRLLPTPGAYRVERVENRRRFRGCVPARTNTPRRPR